MIHLYRPWKTSKHHPYILWAALSLLHCIIAEQHLCSLWPVWCFLLHYIHTKVVAILLLSKWITGCTSRAGLCCHKNTRRPLSTVFLTWWLLLLLLLLFSRSVVSNSLWPHGLKHTRLPCPSPTPGACSNSWPLSQRCHPTISSSVVPFSSCPQSFPASGLFQWVNSSHQVTKILELQL